MLTAGALPETRKAAAAALSALCLGGSMVERLPFAVCCAINATGSSPPSTGGEGGFAAFETGEKERAALLFRALEGKRGAPASREQLEAALLQSGVPASHAAAVPASASPPGSGDNQNPLPEDSFSLTDFGQRYECAAIARDGLRRGGLRDAVLPSPPTPGFELPEPRALAAQGVFLAIQSVVRAGRKVVSAGKGGVGETGALAGTETGALTGAEAVGGTAAGTGAGTGAGSAIEA